MRSEPPAHRKQRKLRKTGRHTAPWTAQKSTKRLGMIAPAFVVAGAVVAWQFNPFATTPVAAGSVAHSHQVLTDLGPVVTGSAESAVTRALRWAAPAHPAASHPGSTPAARASRSTAKQAAQQHATAKPRATVAARPALTCTNSSGAGSAYVGFLPANYGRIVNFLVAHGYTPMAAAGMAGNMYRESTGNPESVGTGGGGLIGWTPLPAGYVTGNPVADLQTQLNAVLVYNQQWAQYIPALDGATSPTQAADIYMNYFERPGIPAAYDRESAASAVAQACGIH